MEWQPIETAPQDGSNILGAHFFETEIEVAQRWIAEIHSYGHDCWTLSGFDGNISLGSKQYPSPTHWMPLPNPPPPSA